MILKGVTSGNEKKREVTTSETVTTREFQRGVTSVTTQDIYRDINLEIRKKENIGIEPT